MTARKAYKWLALAVCASLLRCSGGAPAKVATPDTSESTCHAVQMKPDGTCCPAGQFFSPDTYACQQVGPPECAAVVFNAPEKCVPRWCWDWQDKAATPCTPWSEGCQTEGRACTDVEITEGKGCPAGTFPESDKLGDCAPAGYFPGSGVPRDWDGDLKTLPPVPPLEDSIPPGVPPLTPLPAVDDTFFCRDGPNAEAHFCTAAEMQFCHRGPKGEMPDPKKCIYVGVPWPSVCPPGFIVDEAVKVEAGQLAPCKPDPADCGQDVWPSVDDGADVVYVSADAGSDSGKGTEATPVKTIGQALKLVPSGGTVAVAGGVYNESLAVTKPVTILGRCAALVSVEGKAGVPVLAVSGKKQAGEVVVSGVRLGGKGNGIGVVSGPAVRLERVMVAGVSGGGLYVHASGATVQGKSVVIVGTLPQQSDKKHGWGVIVAMGANVALEDTRLSANRELGLGVADAGTTLSATRLLVDGTLPRASDNQLGWSVSVDSGAQVTLQDARLSAGRHAGLHVSDHGSALDAIGLLVDGTLSRESDKQFGWGVGVENGAQVTLQAARLVANRYAGIMVDGAGTTLDATLLLVDGTLAQASDKQFGQGAVVQGGAQVMLRDTRLSANRDTGLLVDNAGTTLDAARLVVDGTLSRQSDKKFGRGLSVEHGAQVTLQNARLSANRELGIFVAVAGTTLSANGLLVDGTLPQESDQQLGLGVEVHSGARVALQDARLSANRVLGLLVSDAGTVLAAKRILVDGMLSQAKDKEWGSSVAVGMGAQATLRDTRLSASRSIALTVNGAGTVVDAARLLVDGTLSTESVKMFGRGVGVQNGASLRLHAARIVGNRQAGLYASGASMHVAGVTVEATAPSDFDQSGGSGVWLVDHSTAFIAASVLGNNVAAALGADNSAAQVIGCVVLATAWGEYLEKDSSGNATGKTTTLADGILLNASPNSLIDHCLLVGNERAGILVESSPGVKVTRTLINGGKGLYGVVVQHTMDALDQFNAIFGAMSQNRATDAGLSLPKPPEASPTLPANEGMSP